MIQHRFCGFDFPLKSESEGFYDAVYKNKITLIISKENYYKLQNSL